MENNQLGTSPGEAYGGIVKLVEDIFKDDGLILTGSAVGIIDGSSKDTTTHRIVYNGNFRKYYIQSAPKDIDLLVVSNTRLDERPDYFIEKAEVMEKEIDKNQRILLDIAIADPYILTILGGLSNEVKNFEKAHSEENLGKLTEIRNYRDKIINVALNQIGYLFAPLNPQRFLHCLELPSGNQLHSHTSSLAEGNDYTIFGNRELSKQVVEASKSAYIPEELGESSFSSEVYGKLKRSNVHEIREEEYGVFMMLARHEGFRRAEIKEGRKVVGLWDSGFSEETMENIKTFFKSEYSELFDIIYGRK